jgi:hypothetical protein
LIWVLLSGGKKFGFDIFFKGFFFFFNFTCQFIMA